LGAQRNAVETFLNGGDWNMVKEYVEVESGKHSDRPQLHAALAACRVYGAKLVIAKMDRLSRNAHFLLGLQEAGVDFVAADMPNANRLTVGIMAMVAEQEGKAISERTKAALAEAKRRGVKLGGDRGVIPDADSRKRAGEAVQRRVQRRAADLSPTVRQIQATGINSLQGIARALNGMGITTARGGQWDATQVKRLLRYQVA